MASQQQTGRAASMARRQQQVNGKGRSVAASAPARQPNAREHKPTPAVVAAPAQQAAAPATTGFTVSAPINLPRPKPAPKSASRLRRESLAARGKRADKSRDRQRTNEMALSRRSAAEAKSAKGDCGCGGSCCQEAKVPSAVVEPAAVMSAPLPSTAVNVKRKSVVSASSTGRMMSRARRAAMAGRGKAGLEAMGKNSTASLARQANPDITSRDLARTVRDSRSKSGARGNVAAAPVTSRRPRNAAEAKAVSGTKVGHTEKMTGDEAGLCHTGVTGTSYMSADVFDKFCQTTAPKAARKVETSETMRGSRVTTGGKVGNSAVMTGGEKGACRAVTGNEYLGREDFAKCDTKPSAQPNKVSQSQTQRGTVISGPKSSRSENVTGNHKGTCKAVTGTPYAGEEQFTSYCSSEEQRKNHMRTVMPRRPAGVGKDISGIQPGISNNKMTGAETGACQVVSGTPYLAASELKAVCSAEPARPGDADFPQLLGDSDVVAGQFSIVPAVTPAPRKPAVTSAPRKSAETVRSSSVTGSGYEGSGPVTGAFSMGKGKVTGTEQSRFGDRAGNVVSVEPKADKGDVLSRVTGEGIDTGLRITGDDWDRGERVTGTEGSFAARRNPTRRGPMNAMVQPEAKREPQRDRPSAPVTGGSGGTQGSNVAVSGGARG